MSETKKPEPPRYDGASRWWEHMVDDETGDRGALARLRRCATAAEAWSEAETMHLYHRLGFGRKHRDDWMSPVGILAIVLADVRDDAPGSSLGETLGKGEMPILHPLRLRRLTAARDEAETLRGFREVVALLRGTAPVADLARYVLRWRHPVSRDGIRARFLFAYHSAQFAAPKSEETTDETETAS